MVMGAKLLNSLFVISLYFYFCSCTKEENAVTVDFFCFGVYDCENVGDMSLYITRNKCLCSYNQGDSTDIVQIKDYVAKAIWLLADSLFIEKNAQVYDMKKRTDSNEYHEGNQMVITVSKDGDKSYERHLVGEIYYYAHEPQFTEDYYEYIYSDTYRLFCQYIDLIHAYVSGQEAWRCYVNDVYKMSRDPNASVFHAILQTCDSMQTRSAGFAIPPH